MTIGYEGVTIGQFLDTLAAAGVTTLLDVREIAASRRKGFAKTALRENLAAAGIDYRHEPRLGSPRALRHRFRGDGDRARFFAGFEAHLANQRPLVEQLARELSGTVALMCFERDHRDCHRSSVAGMLRDITRLEPRHLYCRD